MCFARGNVDILTEEEPYWHGGIADGRRVDGVYEQVRHKCKQAQPHDGNQRVFPNDHEEHGTVHQRAAPAAHS